MSVEAPVVAGPTLITGSPPDALILLPAPLRRLLLRLAVLVLAGLLAVTGPHLVQTATRTPLQLWGWLLPLAGLAVLSYGFGALALRATGAGLSGRRAFLVQLAAAGASRLTPGGTGGFLLTSRALTRAGCGARRATGLTAALALASGAAGAVLTVVSAITANISGAIRWPAGSPRLVVLGIVCACLTLAGAALAGRARRVGWGRRPGGLAVRTARDLASGWTELVNSPARLAAIVAGQTGLRCCQVAGFVLATRVASVRITVVGAALVYLLGSAAGATVPTPGGIGAVEAALVVGLHAAGAGLGAATAGVLLARSAAVGVPVVLGSAAAVWLRHRGAI